MPTSHPPRFGRFSQPLKPNDRHTLVMNRLFKALSAGSLLLLGGCVTVVDAQAPTEPEFPIRSPLQLSPRAELTSQILTAELAGKRDQLDVALVHYRQAAAALDATGRSEDRALARDVRGFLEAHPDMTATPELFAVRYARKLEAARPKPEPPAPEPPLPDQGRRR